MILGLKLLTKDGESINSSYARVNYPAYGSWVDVPGNGAYIARTGGLTSGGYGPVFAVMECDINTRRATSAPDGVECFGRVRRVPELEVKLKAYAARAKADAAWSAARAKADAARSAARTKADAAWSAAWAKAYDARAKADDARAKAIYPWLREQEAALGGGAKTDGEGRKEKS